MLTTIVFYCLNPSCPAHLGVQMIQVDRPITTNITLDLGVCDTCTEDVVAIDPSIDTHMTMSLHGLA